MTTFIPRLSRISSGKGAPGKRGATTTGAHEARVNVSSLAALVPQIRRRLGLSPAFSDQALLASLIAITRHPTHESRWRAAASSTLGQHLAAGGKDLRHALTTLLSLLPKPYH